ncbi:hypothetical protein AVEN_82532-1 [Araneus ventricosus]|uniref:Uncharacterized protein n=1 Tax=Araneus ventricosus TaxID=182803 RepID=A0A4Y2GS64_ARAVE|nr:hypothetical protein AVEN_82532-1 [Araneus ventricosus]
MPTTQPPNPRRPAYPLGCETPQGPPGKESHPRLQRTAGEHQPTGNSIYFSKTERLQNPNGQNTKLQNKHLTNKRFIIFQHGSMRMPTGGNACARKGRSETNSGVIL